MFCFMTGWEAQQCRQIVLQPCQKYHLCFTRISKGTPAAPSLKTGRLIQEVKLNHLCNDAQHQLSWLGMEYFKGILWENESILHTNAS